MDSKRGEILRYLGTPGSNVGDLDSLIDNCQAELEQIARPRFHYAIIAPAEYPQLIQGKDIAKHLKDAERWVLLAATLGNQVDRQIDIYQLSDLTRAVTLNACATAAIENLCQEAEKDIRAEKDAKGLILGPRFSPGYGDYPLSVQPSLLSILNTGPRLGLTCTSTFYLIPKKSVTAMAALRSKEWVPPRGRCGDCYLSNQCPYKREG